jgi:hypothetical protein
VPTADHQLLPADSDLELTHSSHWSWLYSLGADHTEKATPSGSSIVAYCDVFDVTGACSTFRRFSDTSSPRDEQLRVDASCHCHLRDELLLTSSGRPGGTPQYLFVAAETCSLRHCLPTAASSCSTILAFSHHVTIFCRMSWFRQGPPICDEC